MFSNGLRKMIFLLVVLVGFLCRLDFSQAQSAEEPDIQVQTKSLKEATHFEFSGREDWRYEIHRGQNEVSIQFTGLKGEDLEELSQYKDQRIQVQVGDGLNGDALVTIKYLKPRLNIFDYLTESPVHLVFDLFEEKRQKQKRTHPKEEVLTYRKVTKNSLRNPASVDQPEIGSQPLLDQNSSSSPLNLKYGVFDGGDEKMNRFRLLPGEAGPTALEDAKYRSSHSLYVHFPALVTEYSLFRDVSAEMPKYEVDPKNTEENMQVRLVIKLFNEGKFAVVLKTYKIFQAAYPHSEYQKTLDFIMADTYFKLWKRDGERADFESAMTLYKGLLNKYPDDPSRYRTLVFIGLSYLEVGNNFGALSTFQVGITKYPESPFYWQMRLAEAEVLSRLGKDQASLASLDDVEKLSKSTSLASEARFRRGDVLFAQRNYMGAIAEYVNARHLFPNKIQAGPNLIFNSAESQFWLGHYIESLDQFRDFLQMFPTHSYGALAMVRIGEIFEMMGIRHEKVTGAFLESFHRYRGTSGAFIAKIYINMARYSLMKEKEVEAVKKEINEDLTKFNFIEDLRPFVTLQLSAGAKSRHNYEEALDTLISFYQRNVFSSYLPIFKQHIIRAITDEMNFSLQGQKPLQTAEIYLKYEDSWLKGIQNPDTAYILGQAYERLNLLDDAAKFYKAAIEAKTREPRLGPHIDELTLRMASINLKGGNIKRAAIDLEEIKSVDRLSETEKVEKSLILSQIAEKEERPDLATLALKDLTEHWNGHPELLADAWMRLGRLEFQKKNFPEALNWATKVKEAAVAKNATIPEQTLREAMELTGDCYSQLGKNKSAEGTYKAYLSKYGQNYPVASVKYKLGKIYFDQKDIRSAGEIWLDLKADQSAQVWAKMADENLAEARWNAKYGRYLERTPSSESGGVKP